MKLLIKLLIAGGGISLPALFAASEQGVWYDPSDLSTMYQDAAGTTPCYQPGQGQVDPPVGLMLDKRLGLARGPERLVNGDFSAGAANWSVSGNDATHIATFSGGTLRFQSDTTSPVMLVQQLGAMVTGRWYEITVTVSAWVSGSIKSDNFVQAGLPLASGAGVYKVIGLAAGTTFAFLRASANVDLTIDSISIREVLGNHAYQTTTTSRPTLSARYNLLTATDTLTTQSVTTVATSYTLKLTGAGSVTLSGTAAGSYSAGTYTITCTAGSLTLTVSGSVTQADLRIANDGVGLPPYQSVVDANTYDTVGFPLYLKFDGVDDFLQTASVDFSGTDKVLVSAALRKTSDASVGVICELSVEKNANTGVVALLAPGTNGLATFVWASKGTVEALATATGMPSPISAVLVGLGDISGKISRLRVNGSIIANNAGNQGTGNYGNYPLYIGRRGGTSLPFNGRLYSLLIRGAATPDATIATVESYLNSKARIY